MTLSLAEADALSLLGLSPGCGRETFREKQLALLREALCRAKGKSRFYAQRFEGIDLAALRLPQELPALGFTAPQELAEDPAAFLCVSMREVVRAASARTSGTTGAPKRVFFSAQDVGRTRRFFSRGMRELLEPGARLLVLLSSDAQMGVADLLGAALREIGVQTRSGCDDPQEALRWADCVVATPAQALYLCRTYPALAPKSLLLSADYVPESVLRALRESWSACGVFLHYGMTETGYGFGLSCRNARAYHLRNAEFFTEIIDPVTLSPCADGAWGEVVLTTLSSEGTMLVRYRTGDVSRFLPGDCPCGGVLPRLDLLRRRAGAEMGLLDECIFSVGAVRAYRAEADAAGNLFLTVDALAPLEPQTLCRAAAPFGTLLPEHIAWETLPLPLYRPKRRVGRR